MIAMKQNTMLENIATSSKEEIGRIPETVEQVLVKQLELLGRRWSTLQQDMLNASSKQILQQLQQVVGFPWSTICIFIITLR